MKTSIISFGNTQKKQKKARVDLGIVTTIRVNESPKFQLNVAKFVNKRVPLLEKVN